jgi:hypothetical protein
MSEICSARSTKPRPSEKDGRRRNKKLRKPFGKEQIHRKPLSPDYVAGFIDGEGSFSVSIGQHKTLRRGVEVRPEFEIEVRADDQEILERVLITIGCGRIYDCSYERYGWYPHVKYKITSTREMEEILFPFLDKHPLQAKKAKSYSIFRAIVLMYRKKQHLSDSGFRRIVKLRDRLRALGKKAKTFGKIKSLPNTA